jgi:PhnB protein
MEYYREVFGGGEPSIMPYGDYMPEGSAAPPGLLREWVMHGEMEICGTNVWFADEAETPAIGDNVKLTAIVPSGGEAGVIFNALSNGGDVVLPPTVTFYSVFHAIVKDRFGIIWNVVAEEPPKQ